MNSKRILLVDDSEETRNFIAQKILAPEGYHVQVAIHPQEALAQLQQFSPDLIISDHSMPGMTGLEFLKSLREAGRQTPFILMTAESSESLAVEALRLGAQDYFRKPFQIDTFLKAVTRLLMPTPAPALLHQSSSPILCIDAQARLRFWNQAAQQHLSPGKALVMGQPLSECDAGDELLSLLEEQEGSYSRAELETAQKTFSVDLNQASDGSRVLVLHDISSLRELDKLKSDFVSAVSHDLRSPLTTILGYVDLMRRVGPLNESQQKFADNIVMNVKSITELLTDLLDLSKIEAGFEANFEPVYLDAIIRHTVEAQRGELSQKAHKLELQLQDNIPAVQGSPTRLRQVVQNLIQNAIKYTPPGGHVKVHLHRDQRFVVLQVTDTGIGIPPEEQALIWDKFYRAQAAVSDFPGTGLGLAIVKGIIDQHGGRIWVESVPNQGSTFSVMLEGIDE